LGFRTHHNRSWAQRRLSDAATNLARRLRGGTTDLELKNAAKRDKHSLIKIDAYAIGANAPLNEATCAERLLSSNIVRLSRIKSAIVTGSQPV
jgi:hypothetical protein